MTSGLRRVRHAAAPMQKMIAETARYQPIAISRARGGEGRLLLDDRRPCFLYDRRPCFLYLLDGRAQPGRLGHRAVLAWPRLMQPALELDVLSLFSLQSTPATGQSRRRPRHHPSKSSEAASKANR